MKRLMLAALVAASAVPALAQDVTVEPERRALLVSIIEGLGCRMNGSAPPKEFLDAMEEHKFVKEETRAIARQLLEEGTAERSGSDLILKTENCT